MAAQQKKPSQSAKDMAGTVTSLGGEAHGPDLQWERVRQITAKALEGRIKSRPGYRPSLLS